MKVYAFRVFAAVSLLLSLFANIYMPVQAGHPDTLPPAAAPAAQVELVPAIAAARISGLVDMNAAGDDRTRSFTAPQTVEPAPLAALPNAPVLVSPADGAAQVPTTATLTVSVSDPDGGSVKVSFYGRRKTSETAPAFTVAALPDTQNYVESTSGAAIFNAVTQYIADSQSARNTVFVTHLGDITNNGSNDTDQSEWIVADNAMKILDRSTTTYADDVPYSMMPGNHDNLGGLTNYNAFFGVSRFEGRPYYGAHYGTDNITNYSTFSVSGMHFILINIACFSSYPSPAMLSWADSLLKEDLSRRGIVACHSAMNTDGSFASFGQSIFNALSDNPNLFLILAGHAGIARRQDVGTDGHTIYSVMSDYSGADNGGDGLFRLYEFQPAKNQIQVYTYSPTTNKGAGGYLTGSADQFTLPYAMRSPDFTLIGSTTVNSGANASITWPNLLGSTQYEWYAVAQDASDVKVGPTQSFTTGPNNADPQAMDDSYATAQDTPLSVTAPGVLGNDSAPDGKTLTAVMVNGASHGSAALGSNGSFTYTPASGFYGTDTFTYKANDGTKDSNTATVTITVTRVNHAPVANKDTTSTQEDTPFVVNVLSNDTDPDGDALTVTGITAAPKQGTAVVQDGTTVLYTPNNGFYGSDSFTYAISDGSGGTASAVVSVTVTHVNHAPAASDGSITTEEDTPESVDLVASDYDGDALTYRIVDSPEHGTLSGSAPHLTYTPNANFNGSDSFTFQAKDASLYSSTATVSVTVTPVNDAPICADLAQAIDEDNALDIAPNCTDVDGDSITIQLTGSPAHGQVSLSGGAFHYQPEDNYNGTDSFTYQASDGQIDSAQADVNITIQPVDDAPVCQEIQKTVNEDTALFADPLCSDIDSPSLSYVIDVQPQHGEASIEGDKLRYQPAAEYSGTDSFRYKAYDGTLYSSSAAVSVTINTVIDPPVMDSISPLVINEGSLLSFTAKVTPGDVPLEKLAFHLSGDTPKGASMSSAGAFTWTPTEAQGPGSFAFSACVEDGVNPPVCQPVSVTVNEVNQAPVLADIPAQRVRRNTLLTFTAAAADADLPKNHLTFSLRGDNVPPGALLDPSTGVFSWAPDAAQPLQTYPFAICASDGTDQVCKPVSVTVVDVFFLPVLFAAAP